MNQLVQEKTEAIDALIADLQENFVDKFWETLSDINQAVAANDREALVWRALTRKALFLRAAQDLRDSLISGLAESRERLTAELNQLTLAFDEMAMGE
jgi:hypothetical protein